MDQFKSSPLAQETAWLDMLGLVDLDSLTDRARFDELFDVSPHTLPNIPQQSQQPSLFFCQVKNLELMLTSLPRPAS